MIEKYNIQGWDPQGSLTSKPVQAFPQGVSKREAGVVQHMGCVGTTGITREPISAPSPKLLILYHENKTHCFRNNSTCSPAIWWLLQFQRKGNTQHLMWRTERNHNKNAWQSLSDPGKKPNHTNVLLQQDMFINHTQSHPEKHNLLRGLFCLFLTFPSWKMTQGELCQEIHTTPVCLEWPTFGHKCPSGHKANIINHLIGVFNLQSILNLCTLEL